MSKSFVSRHPVLTGAAAGVGVVVAAPFIPFALAAAAVVGAVVGAHVLSKKDEASEEKKSDDKPKES